jgi:hypothetical protein
MVFAGLSFSPFRSPIDLVHAASGRLGSDSRADTIRIRVEAAIMTSLRLTALLPALLLGLAATKVHAHAAGPVHETLGTASDYQGYQIQWTP